MSQGPTATTLGAQVVPEEPLGPEPAGIPVSSRSPQAAEASEAPDATPRPIPDGVCRACLGAKAVRTELTHNCTNCSGKGYCAASAGGNRFICTFCRGTGQVVTYGERNCEACGGTGSSRTPGQRGDGVDKVRFEGQSLVLENLTLSVFCLMSALGLFFFIVGFAFLMGKFWALAGLGIAAGVACLVFASAHRAVSLRRARQAAAKEQAYATGESSRAGREDPGLPDPQARAPLSCDHLVTMFALVALPSVFLLYLFSDMGIGIEVFNAVAPHHMNLLGDVTIFLASLVVGALAVFDWLHWPLARRACSAAVPVVLLVVASVLKGRKYSWAPFLMAQSLEPIGLGVLRTFACRHVRRASFYKAASFCMLVCSLLLLVAWLLWIAVGGNDWGDDTRLRLIGEASRLYEYVYSKRALDYHRDCSHLGRHTQAQAVPQEERQDVASACSTAATVLFLAYSGPFVASVCNGVMAAFCYLVSRLPDLGDLGQLQQAVQLFGLAVVTATAGFFATVSIASASFRLGSTLLAFLAAAFMALLAWGYMELGRTRLRESVARSEGMRIAEIVAQSDWSKAIVLGGFNVLLPVGFLLSMMNMKVRRWRGLPGSEATFTPTAEKILAKLRAWNWVSVLTKVCCLGELFFTLQVGVAKVTYILLSGLNTELAKRDFGVVVIFSLVIGYIMFLFPPVPGPPVYVFVGVVVSARGRLTDGVGFVGGLLIAVMLSFLMKQAGCVSQYLIGFCLGRSVKVQQFVGVDQVITRALERILKEPGLSFAKISILVGGPDWPTSATCGILRLNVLQMVWGTCPVIVVIAPCVMAGAFLSRVTPGEDSIWNLLSDTAVGLAAVANGVSMLIAFYKILAVAQRHYDELAAPRPEHAVVAEMSRRKHIRHEAYLAVTNWETLGVRWKAMLVSAAAMQLGCGFVFTFMSEACFLDFSVSSNIDDPIPEGLGGDPFAIVHAPLGWVPIGIFFLATLMHVIFVTCMGRLAALRLGGVGAAAPAGPEPVAAEADPGPPPDPVDAERGRPAEPAGPPPDPVDAESGPGDEPAGDDQEGSGERRQGESDGRRPRGGNDREGSSERRQGGGAISTL